MPTRESDSLSAAIAATDAELFASALGNEAAVHDDTDDRSLEQQDDGLEGKVEDEGKEVEAAADDAVSDGEQIEAEGPKKDPLTGQFVKADTAEPPKDGKGEPRIPPGRLRETTERAKAAETALAAERAAREEDKRERDAIRAQMELLSRQIAQGHRAEPPKPKADAPARPDKFADPEGYDLWVENQIAAARNETRDDFSRRLVNMNLASTRDAQPEKFDTAYRDLITAINNGEPEAELARQRVMTSVNPGGELLRWHRSRETLRRVGDNPEVYEQKLRDETRAALLADPEFRKEILAFEVSNGTQPRHVTRLPAAMKSLNGASGSGHLAEGDPEDTSDQGLFNSALAR
jgi:hypothetical protein